MTQHKRRRPGEGGVYQRPNGTYAGVISLGFDATGKRRRRFVYGKTERDVLDQLRELRKQLDTSGDLPTGDITLSKWLTIWLADIAAKRVKPGTLVSYRTAVNRYITPSIGKRPLSRLTPAHVRQMHAHVRDQGCNSTTARNAHRVLAAALNDAIREGRVGRNVAALEPAPRKAVSARGPLSFPEAKALLVEAGKDERTAGRWVAAFMLGARQGEVLGLQWSHVDLTKGLVDIAWSLQRVGWAHGCGGGCGNIARACPMKVLPIPDGYEFRQLDGNLTLLRPKTDTSRRVVPLPDVLLAALTLRQQQAREEPNPHGLVWTRPDGRPIHPRDDWATWKSLLADAGVTRKVTLHEARHSTATWLADDGTPENVIVDLLGHSDVLMTRSYTHLSPATGRQALNALGARLGLT
jgi:integrase